MIIQDFKLCHTFLPLGLSNFIFNKDNYDYENKSIITNIANLVIFVIEFILALIFLELIELNFCGLSKNLKKNIRIRAENDLFDIINEEEEREIIMINDQYYIVIEDEENKEIENESINSKLEMAKKNN